jgi:hypothetical protein
MRWQWIVLLGFGLLWGSYLLQLTSPLRTNTDATVFLDLASSASDGNGFLLAGKPTHFPIGYPMILAGLDRAGLACSASFIALNLVALAVGMAATSYVLGRSFRLGSEPLVIISCLTLLSWVYVKHVTLPLSDLPYFGLAQSCLALLTWSSGRSLRSRLVGTGLAVLLAGAAIAVRTVGIALLPALVLACLPADSVRRGWAIATRHRGRGLALVLGLFVLLASVSPIIMRTRYFEEFLERWHDSVGLGELVSYKLSDWGEIVFNTSAAKLPDRIRWVVGLAGALVPISVCWGMRQRDQIAAIDAYAISYFAILLVWPYQDARFWIPVLPIILGYVALGWERLRTVAAVRWAVPAYLAAFSVLGVVALAYSTWISVEHDRFPDRFAGGVYRGSYRAAWKPDSSTGDSGAAVDPQIVRLVQRYSRPSR